MRSPSKILITVSGQTIGVDGVLLHSAAAVGKWQNLLARAQPLLGTFSSGIGIWGTPGMALAGAAAIGFLEAAVTNANQKQGLHLLGEAFAMYERLKPRGRFVQIADISAVELPDIARWRSRGTVTSELDVRSAGILEKAKWRSELGATDDELRSGFIVRETMQDLVVLPDDFVTCRAGQRSILIKWSAVDMYEIG